MNNGQQLPLNLKKTADKSFQNFIIANNKPLVNSLLSFVKSNESLFFLWGTSGSGKSHLLQALVKEKSQAIAVLDYQELKKRENISLIQLFDIICIDNAEKVASDRNLEISLFNWINEVRQQHKKIILSSQIANKDELWQLPDLISRLQSGQTHELITLDRKQSMHIFKQQASQQGIKIDEKIESYLSKNSSMNLKSLSNLLTKIDEITLVQKKQLTIPLLKKIINTKVVN